MYTPLSAPYRSGRLFLELVCAGILLTLIIVIIYLGTPLGEIINSRATDYLLDRYQKPAATDNTITVTIDDSSLERYGQWPWPRYRLARLLETITDGQAKRVAMNIFLPERDRTSPVLWEESLKREFGYSIDTSAIPEMLLDYDEYLANTIAKSQVILGYRLLFEKRGSSEGSCNPQPPAITPSPASGDWKSLSLYQARDILCNYGPIGRSASTTGHLNGVPDRDGVMRRLPLLIEFDDRLLLSFGLATYLGAENTDSLRLEKGPLGINYLQPGNIPIDKRGNFLFGGSGPEAASISALKLLSPGFDSSLFRDKIVFVGVTASGLGQSYPLADGSNISMVDVHRLTYRAIAGSSHVVRGDLFSPLEAAVSFLLVLLLAAAVYRLPLISFCCCFFTLFTLVLTVPAGLFTVYSFLFSPVLPMLCLVLSSLLMLMLKFKHCQKHADSAKGSALQLLEITQSNLHSILNTVPDIIFRLDAEGRIIFISSAISKYENEQQSLLGKPIMELVHSEDLEKAKHKLNERRTGNRATMDLEIRLRLTLGDDQHHEAIRYFSVSAAGLYNKTKTDPQKFIGTQGIAKDITSKKQMEQQLLQAKKMEAIGNLAAGIAHDLNNILSGIVSYPEMILAELSEDDPLYKKISLIQKSGRKAAVIVQDLLTISRRHMHQEEVCDLNRIIRDYLSSAEHERALRICQGPVQIHTNICVPSAPVLGSPVHISKTVMNLVFNAIEAMPTGGMITITTAIEEVESAIIGYEEIPPGRYVCLSVKDSGVGIEQEDLHKIFEPFFTKKPGTAKGTGLGMSIIWATVKDHSGFIDITSIGGDGTLFSIYLPAVEQDVEEHENDSDFLSYTGTETILIVDDQEEQLTIGRTILEKLGYTVLTSNSGTEALKILKDTDVDLVILDMIMPGDLDGLDTFEKILEISPGQKTIIASGYSESERVKKMQEMGAGPYVQKPFSIDIFARTIRKELDRS